MISLNLPINGVSFGQVSTGFLRELHRREEESILSLIANNADLSSQKEDSNFNEWIRSAVFNFLPFHNRKNKIFKLWHINGSMESFSEKQVLLSFYELDNPTRHEVNIVKNNYKVLFSAQESVDIFRNLGCDNVEYIPLYFDSDNFKITNKQYFEDGRIVFNVAGKLERRKHHVKTIRAWARKYGNNPKYSLQCAIYNNFLTPEQNQTLVNQITEGKKYFNINFLGFMGKNEIYNDYLNSADIIISMSGGEGWGLPEFQSVAMGKHSVTLDASGYKGWANKKNSVLVKPSGKITSVDNIFFRNGDLFNQGDIYDFTEDSFIDGCEEAIKRFEKSKVNGEGLKLQQEFSVQKFTDKILNYLK
jgi:glycosyltransferase involved in cell wall biosynthesis